MAVSVSSIDEYRNFYWLTIAAMSVTMLHLCQHP